MKMVAFLIAAVCLGAAVANPLLGQERCAEGPTFWCQDVKTASGCGAVKHCQQTVWRQPTVKSAPCDLCKEVVSVMGNLLKDNATEAELRGYLEKACDLLPSPTLTTQCNELVDDYLPIILDILKGELSNDAVCLDCTQFITDIQTAVKEKSVLVDELLAQLKQQCNLGPGLTELCEKYIAVHGPQVAEILMQTDAKEICTVHGFCQKPATVPMQLLQEAIVNPVQKSPMPMVTSQGCVMCEFALQQIEKLLQQNRTEEMITNAVAKVCSILPATIESECEDFVKQYGKAVVELLAQELDPAFVCTAIGLCKNTERVVVEKIKPKQLKAGPLCEICKTVVEYLDGFLESNATEKEIEAALDKVCDLLPASVRDECNQLVEQYGPTLLKILLETMDPDFVCTNIGVCLGAKKHLVGADKCVWGPSYWCTNMETANQCNAVEHCKRHIWN
ncbi:prosaposin isoform X2 [Carcharodon carcharias]|uniref:prosaposin isoform X2 n=1 Tax=Carcharodon carcharias TaxID=13397 RepID=UPI001B7F12C6|nr:prosaposin isoform X2 [Carcharodon carcharias]